MKLKNLVLISVLTLLFLFTTACDGQGSNDDDQPCTHEYGEWQVVNDATCENDGLKQKVCSLCEDVQQEVINKLNHAYGDWESNHDGTHSKVCANDQNHILTEDCSSASIVCGEAIICDHCNDQYSVALDHEWNDGEVIKKASCTETGEMVFTCTNCGETESVILKATNHKYEEVVTEAKCTTKGYTTHTCINEGCDYSYIDSETNATGHKWDQELSCEKGHKCVNDSCDAEEAALGHSYELIDEVKASCEVALKHVYECQKCFDQYEESIGSALGHNITGVKAVEKHLEDCEYQLTYQCLTCLNEVLGDKVYHHNYIASVTLEATCQENGEKTLLCECGDKQTEVISKNNLSHQWNEGNLVGNIRTYSCEHDGCKEIKTVVDASSSTKADVTASDLANAGGVQLENANIALDDTTLSQLKDKDLTISSDTLVGEDLNNVMSNLTDEQKSQLGAKPTIYNFLIEENGSAISNFKGTVTVTLPYTLGENEDVDSIAVWYMNGDKPESIKATYSNGYITFETTHFSYYTVTKLTPKERCELYGHNYVTNKVEGTCLTDGYELSLCVRCHDTIKTITKVAEGHKYEEEVTPATCTKDGLSVHSCINCDYSYQVKIQALNHDWKEIEHVDPTCDAAGYTSYSCDNCKETYKQEFAQLTHVFKDTVIEATCEEDGYTLHKCEKCDYQYTDQVKEALGHNYSTTWSWNKDYSAATLTLTCKNDEKHNSVIDAEVTIEKTTATCKNPGKEVYTALVTYKDQTYQDVVEVVTEIVDHTKGEEIKYDKKSHWYECSVCGTPVNSEEHSLDEGKVLVDATCKEEGKIKYSCSCGYAYEETIPVSKEHTKGEEIKHDEKSHWYECSVCGTPIDSEKHSLDEGSVLVDATCKEEGKIKYSCSCGYSYEKVLPVSKEHTYEDGTCTVCGKVESECDHETLHFEYFSLGDYGFCGGLICYNICECGEVSYLMADYSDYDCEIDTVGQPEQWVDENGVTWAKQTGKCQDCDFGMTLIASMKMNGCTQIVNYAYTFLNGDDIILDNCEYGYEYVDHDSSKAVIDLKDYSTCGGTISYYLCDDCGEVSSMNNCKFECASLGEIVPEKIKDESGKVRYVFDKTCEDCGLHVYLETYQENNNCNITYGTIVEISIKEKEILSFTEVESELEHDIIEEYKPLGDDCKDGIEAHVHCSNCDFDVTYTKYSHNFDEGEIDLSEYSNCGLIVYAEKCTICEKVGYYRYEDGCNFNYMGSTEKVDENGVVHQIETYSCYKCKIVRIRDSYQEQIKDCYYTRYEKVIFYYGEEVILECVDSYNTSTHEYEYTYELFGDSCEDGYTYTATCKTCGDSYSGERDSHSTDEVVNIDLKEYGACGGYIQIHSCPCKQETYVNYNIHCSYIENVREYTDENGVMHRERVLNCNTCNVEFIIDSWQIVDGCYLIEYRMLNCVLNEEVILEEYAYTYNVYDNHNYEYEYTLYGDSCEDGVSYKMTCTLCGYVDEDYNEWHNEIIHKTIDLSKYSACGGSVEYNGCACGYYSYFNNNLNCNFAYEESNYTDESGVEHYITKQSCETCDLEYLVDRYRAKNGCIIRYYYEVTITVGEVVVLDKYKYSNSYTTSHNYEYEYTLEGDSCEDGVSYFAECKDCGETSSGSYSYHEKHVKEIIDLKEYNVCGGQISLIECACGLVKDLEWANGCEGITFDYKYEEETGNIEIYICETCNFVLTRQEESIIDGCVTTYYYKYNAYVGDNTLVSDYLAYRESYKNHTYKTEYTLLGSSCEDGVEYIRICTKCGYQYSNTIYWHEELINEEIYLSEFGACGGYIYYYGCACGSRNYFRYELDCNYYSESSSYTDENNIPHSVTTYKCDQCNLVLVQDDFAIIEGCKTTHYYNYSVSIGEKVVVENYQYKAYTETNHQNTFEYKLLGTSCEDGVEYTRTCSVCGETYTGTYYYHEVNNDLSYNLSDYGVCGGYVEISKCVCGERQSFKWELDCNYTYESNFYEEDGISYALYTYKCDSCLITLERLVYTIKEDCKRNTYHEYIVKVGEEVLVDNYKELYSSYDEHNLTYEYTLNGTSCEDGVSYIEKCLDCDYYYDGYMTFHGQILEKEYDFKDYGGCGGYVIINSCPCGEENSFNWNLNCNYKYEDNTYEEDGITYTIRTYKCDSCLVTMERLSYIVKEDCKRNTYREYTVKVGEEVLVENYKELYSSYDDHNFTYEFTLNGTSCEDGVSYIEKCLDCDYSYEGYTNYHERFLIKEYDFEDYDGCGGYANMYSCACGENKSFDWSLECNYTYEFNTYEENGITYTLRTYKCDSCLVTREILEYTLKEGCKKNTYREYTVKAGEEVLVESFKVLYSSYNDHNYTYEFTLNGTSCEDGVTYIQKCLDCDYYYEGYTNYHESFLVYEYDFEDYGGCGGYFNFNSCPCKETNSYYLSLDCNYNYNYENYKDENGILHEVVSYTCSTCNLRIQKDSYTIHDSQNCKDVEYVTIYIICGANIVADLKYENKETNHNYLVEGELNEGSSSCSDGATITFTCKDCDYSYSDYVSYHHKYQIETFDLNEYGAVCGGYYNVLQCACGQNTSIESHDLLCDFDSTYTNVWIENYSTSYSNYAYIMKCVVTDPEQCAFAIRYAYYYLLDENDCKVYRYATYQFGYNELDGTYAYEYTFKTGESYICHHYEEEITNGTYDEGTWKCTKNVCSVCGTSSYSKYYYDENNRKVKYEYEYVNNSEYENLVYKFEQLDYSTYTDRYGSQSNYTSYKYLIEKYRNGNEYWLTATNVYDTNIPLPFGDYGLRITYNEISSYGDEVKDIEEYVIFNDIRYYTYEYRLEKYQSYGSEYWSEYKYTYSFSPTCQRTVEYKNSDGETNAYTESCHRTNYYTSVPSTCTQDGKAYYKCSICSTVTDEFKIDPHGHYWYNYHDGYYECYYCGIKNANGANGDIIVEDLTNKYGNDTEYVVGYYAQNTVEYTYYVSLMVATEVEGEYEEVILSDITYNDVEGLRAISFNKDAVANAAEALGYETGTYSVKFSFVPFGADDTLDYGLIFE